MYTRYERNPCNNQRKKCDKVLKFPHSVCGVPHLLWLLGTNDQTDLHALNNFSFSIDKVSFKKNSMSLGLVLLEKKLFTRTPTWTRMQTPQSEAIIIRRWVLVQLRSHNSITLVYEAPIPIIFVLSNLVEFRLFNYFLYHNYNLTLCPLSIQ